LAPRSASDSIAPAIVSRNDPEKGDVLFDNGGLVAAPGFRFEKVAVDLLEVGDVVRVQNGATPPSDGTIVSGAETSFDESSLTGEARSVAKNIGDKVLLGTINKSKAVDVRVDAISGVTMLVNQLQFCKYCSDLFSPGLTKLYRLSVRVRLARHPLSALQIMSRVYLSRSSLCWQSLRGWYGLHWVMAVVSRVVIWI
jgi:hypothetical protein